MIVTYIYHSCYLIEFDGFSILIDYYTDVRRKDGSWWIKDYLLQKKEDVYVLSTHSHHDHFNPEILSWKQRKENITYIFSTEVLSRDEAKEADAFSLDKLDKYEDENISVEAFGSTDIGGSFLITHHGKLIFHAGDLNNWHWMEEVEKDEALTYENNYLCELELLGEEARKISVVMFPIDPRLGKNYMRGAEQFLLRINAEYFLPMHFGENYHKANAFAAYAREHNCRFLEITGKGQSFII